MIGRQLRTTVCTLAIVLTGFAAGDSAAAGTAVDILGQSSVCSVNTPIAPQVVSAVPTPAAGSSRDFYNTVYQTAAAVAAAAGAANPLTISPAQLTDGDNNFYALAAEAFMWGLPLELFWEKQGGFTNTTAAINQLYLSPEIDRSAFIVSPNTDVLYANGFLDLSRNPQAIKYPQADTFNMLQIMDPYTNVQGSVGTRVNACGEVILYWAQAAYAAQVKAAYPNNSIAIYSPQVWLIGRVAVDSQAVQARNGVPQTLYQYGNGSSNSPLALWRSQEVLAQYSVKSLTEYVNTGTISQSPVVSAPTTSDAFYTSLSQAVQKNGLLVNYSGATNGSLNATSTVFDQTAMFANFAAMGLSTRGFDTSSLSAQQKTSISQGYAAARAALALIANSGTTTSATNYWTLDMSLGQYVPSYQGWLKNATVALIGLGANLAADGAYPRATADSTATGLTGAAGNQYRLDFSSTGTPPITANGFWSVTVYDANSNIYPSAANRYYYTSEVGGVYALGSIQFAGEQSTDRDGPPVSEINQTKNRTPTLYFQSVPPSDSALLPYYIPVPAGPFSLQMRVYDAIAGNQSGVTTILNSGGQSSPQWIPPPVQKAMTGTTTELHMATSQSAPGQFDGSTVNNHAVNVRMSPDDYPTPHHLVYLGPDALFLFGGGSGDRGETASFVARVDPNTLRPVWFNQLIGTVEVNVLNNAGPVSVLQDGFLYVVSGTNLVKLDVEDGRLLGRITLPIGAARDTTYDSVTALSDGALVVKSAPGTHAPSSILLAIDPGTLEIIDQVVAPELVSGRISATVFDHRSYVYLTGETTVCRYLYQDRRLTLDTGWNPGALLLPGQSAPTAVVVMSDWVILETNAVSANTAMSVIAINQADASRQFSGQPFLSFAGPKSWSPSAAAVDVVHNRIFVADGGVGRVAALELRSDGLYLLWTAPQRTSEFLALIGPAERRVLVGTDAAAGQQPGANTQDFVVWRSADGGNEMTRSQLLPAVNGTTVIEPGHAGRAYRLAQNGKIVEVTPANVTLPAAWNR